MADQASHAVLGEVEEQTIPEFAAHNMGKEILNFMVQEFRAMPDVWQKLSEEKQASVLERARIRIEGIVERAVSIIAEDGKISVVADLESCAIKDEIKAVFKVSRGNPIEDLHELFGSVNRPCLLVVADSSRLLGGMHDVRPDPNQPQLQLDDESTPENGMDDGPDPLYAGAVAMVRETKKTTISAVQRALHIGYNRAARLIERMELEGVLSSMDSTGNRRLLDI